MALRQYVEWGPEEVAAGYDLSSIFEDEDNNTTASVISSVVNTTDHITVMASPVLNITAGLNNLVKEVVKQMAEMVVNTTLNPTTMASTTVAPPSSFTLSTVSTIVKRVVEHLGNEPNISVATVCIIFFNSITHTYCIY